MSTLYEIVGDFNQLYELATDPECDPEVLEGTLECIEGDLELKAIDYAHVIKNLEAHKAELKGKADFLAEETKRAKAEQEALDNNIARIKNRLKDALIATGHADGIKAGTYKMKVVNNGGVLPLQVDKDNVPDNYMKITYSIDNDKIREALNNGVELSFASFLPRGTRLDIR